MGARNTTFRFLAVISAFLASSPRFAIAADQEFVGTDFDKRYVIVVSEERLRGTPSWEKGQNPPLSARKALKLANEFRNTFVKDARGWKWEFQSLGLKQSPRSPLKWHWVAYYQEYPVEGALGGAPPDLFVVVLMDGTVVKPVVKARND